MRLLKLTLLTSCVAILAGEDGEEEESSYTKSMRELRELESGYIADEAFKPKLKFDKCRRSRLEEDMADYKVNTLTLTRILGPVGPEILALSGLGSN